GAESISWQARLECCGAPLFGSNDALSVELTQKKLTSATQSGAQFICDACPYCHLQFDTVQGMITHTTGNNNLLPAILYPQLLGLSMGIDGKTLGLAENKIDITSIEGFLSE
ncbi:MAG: disulfide reductase, partial [Deltaproteobacteria bacterium]